MLTVKQSGLKVILWMANQRDIGSGSELTAHSNVPAVSKMASRPVNGSLMTIKANPIKFPRSRGRS